MTASVTNAIENSYFTDKVAHNAYAYSVKNYYQIQSQSTKFVTFSVEARPQTSLNRACCAY